MPNIYAGKFVFLYLFIFYIALRALFAFRMYFFKLFIY